MNSSAISLRDLNDVFSRAAKSFCIKLIALSLLFSFGVLIFAIPSAFNPDQLQMQILNAKLDLTSNYMGRSVNNEIKSEVWNAGPDSCTQIKTSKGFAFLSLDNCSPETQISNAISAGIDGIIYYVPSDESLNLQDQYDDIYIFQTSIDFGSIVIDYTPFRASLVWDEELFLNMILSEVLQNLFLSFLSGLIVLAGGLIIELFQNYKENGKLRIRDAVLKGSLILLDIDFRGYAPRLYSIPFPEHRICKDNLSYPTMKRNDLENGIKELSYSQHCCVVCLEDFQEDHLVRSLPCNHVFHSEW